LFPHLPNPVHTQIWSALILAGKSPAISDADQLEELEADGNLFRLETEAGSMQLFKTHLPVVFFICRPKASQKKKSCPPAAPKDFASVPPALRRDKAAQLQRKHPD